MQLKIAISDQPGWTVLAPAGEVDLATVGQLEEAINGSINGQNHIAIDLSAVTFMDSTGLRALLTSHETMSSAGRRLALVVSGGPVNRLLDISGVAQTLEIFTSLEAATA